jgi:protoheme IX farnesyltransferase
MTEKTLPSAKSYYLLTKPGIIMGNIMTMAGGFALASSKFFNFWLFLATLIGTALVIASACIFNNYIDRIADGKMERTRSRALVKGDISTQSAILFASFLGLLGALFLALFANLLAMTLALFGFFVYVILYSFSKYRTVHGTLIGSIAGAIPPVVGYCAASHFFDRGAILLFVMIALWQMPHFFAIAIYRLEDYAAAFIPVMPLKRGMHKTKIQMLLYVIAFTAVSCLLTLFGYVSQVYLIVSLLLGSMWIALALAGFKADNDRLWARKMFLFSLVVILGLCVAIPLTLTA